jgi:hypothetical protein
MNAELTVRSFGSTLTANPMGWKGTLRAMEAAQRRQQRDAQKRQRELDRRNKELAKLSAIERAKLEVETYENQLEVLLSVHKAQGEVWDWTALAAALPPVSPQKSSYHEIRARQNVLVLHPSKREGAEAAITQAQNLDEQIFQDAIKAYTDDKIEWEKLKHLALRILAGEHKAFIEALVELSPLGEITDVGSLMHFTVESTKLIGCELKVNGSQAIPPEVKALTASEQVSVKPMPKARFHEIYQDYICGCMLRVTREVLAMLPVDAVLITASAQILDPSTGRTSEQPVLSAVMPRTIISRMDFDRLNPADAMENFLHRSNFKATRKAGAFQPITPLMASDVATSSIDEMGFTDLITSVQRMRNELKSKMEELNPPLSEPALESNPPL